jgi:hypothetical protein
MLNNRYGVVEAGDTRLCHQVLSPPCGTSDLVHLMAVDRADKSL